MARHTAADIAADIAAGFKTKAAQKNATDRLARLYDEARNATMAAILTDRRAAEEKGEAAEALESLYWAIPLQLNHVRARHIEACAAYPAFACVPELVQLREAAKATPIVKAAPRARTSAEIADEANRRTCQICARPIMAKAGRIAHHGYSRPFEGFQTSSCEGALHLPFEVSADVLRSHVAAIGDMIARKVSHLAKVEAESVAIVYRFDDKAGQPAFQNVTRETFAADLDAIKAAARYRPSLYSFDALKRDTLRTMAATIESLRKYEAMQTGRLNSWQPVN